MIGYMTRFWQNILLPSHYSDGRYSDNLREAQQSRGQGIQGYRPTKKFFWSAQVGSWRARESEPITGVWDSEAERPRLLEVMGWRATLLMVLQFQICCRAVWGWAIRESKLRRLNVKKVEYHLRKDGDFEKASEVRVLVVLYIYIYMTKSRRPRTEPEEHHKKKYAQKQVFITFNT